MIRPVPGSVTVKDTAYVKFVGNPDCNYIKLDLLQAVSLVAQSIYHDFPEAKDRRLWVGDCCPWSGNCPGHPGTSHGKQTSLDINYYTFADSNLTQYPGTKDRIELWSDPGFELLPGVFDAERTFYFLYRLKQLVPGTVCVTNDVIATAIQAVSALPLDIQTDTGVTYNHHRHSHISLGEVDYTFKIHDFLNLRGN